MFKNQNQRSVFILVMMLLILLFFFVYLFIPRLDKKVNISGSFKKKIPDFIIELSGGFEKKVKSEFSKIYKKEKILFDIEFVEYDIFSNLYKKYYKVEVSVFSVFNVNYSVFLKKNIKPLWIKDLIGSDGGESFELIDLDVRSEKLIINSVLYNDKEDFFLFVYERIDKNSGISGSTPHEKENINKMKKNFKNVILFRKKDLVFKFRLMKFGKKMREIYND